MSKFGKLVTAGLFFLALAVVAIAAPITSEDSWRDVSTIFASACAGATIVFFAKAAKVAKRKGW
jgi:hypothetical protein